MHEKHFGFRQRPFRSTPDSGCYYPATSHERALHRLLQSLGDDEGLVLLTGEPGIGKTLLCHCLLERLEPDYTSVFLTNSHCDSRAGLLQAMLYDLSLPYAGQSEQELRLTLTDFLLQNYAKGKKTVLVLDEAQHLGPDLLEELRLLSNLEAQQGKAVQIALFAQSSILETLSRPEMAAFSQRLAVRVRLAPLQLQEAADYLLHHVRLAGGRPEAVFSEEALEMLARSAQGIPRLLNRAAHEALTLASQAQTDQIDAEITLEALSILGMEAETARADTMAYATDSTVAESAPAKPGGLIAESDSALRADGEEGPPVANVASVSLMEEAARARRLLTIPPRPA